MHNSPLPRHGDGNADPGKPLAHRPWRRGPPGGERWQERLFTVICLTTLTENNSLRGITAAICGVEAFKTFQSF